MIKETDDLDLVKKLFNHPSLCHYLPTAEGRFLLPEGARYFVAEKQGEPVGIIYFKPLKENLWEGHFMIRPEGKGFAARYAKQALNIMKEQGAGRIIGFTPKTNVAALRAAFSAGMKYIKQTDRYYITEFIHD